MTRTTDTQSHSDQSTTESPAHDLHRHFGCRHNPLHCFLPPDILEHMAESDDPDVRRAAVDAIGQSAAFRAVRDTLATMPIMAAIPSPDATRHRLIYDMKESNNRFRLPGDLVRKEGDGPVDDEAVNEAYDYAGATYDFYKDVFNRNSLDDRGMALISTVHFGRRFNNAFWNGEQMTYGDGDGRIFIRFTKSLDVAGHEMSHGIVQHTANLIYENEPGALNEHFADVFGILVEQWHKKQTVTCSDWFIGGEIMAPDLGVKGLRTFTAEKAFENNAVLGTDRQPKHMDDKYTGTDDHGGVHVNSGIPNHAFYLVATELGGNAWEKAGDIWYHALLMLNRFSEFQEAAEVTHDVAGRRHGAEVAKVVKSAWERVGIKV